jgi:chromatin remodeling complex protein RSC6
MPKKQATKTTAAAANENKPPVVEETKPNVEKKVTKKKSTTAIKSTVVENPAPIVEETTVAPAAAAAAVTEEAIKSVDEDKPESDTKSDKSETEKNAFITKLNLFTSKVAAINREVRELQSIGRTLERDFTQVIRVITKQKSKNKSNMENRPLSGFAMPSLLSKELYSFLNIEEGTRIPRKDVTRKLNEYIKERNLRDEKDKRRITPDAALMKIFGCKETDNVTYFNLQTYMKHHFIKDVKPAAVTAPVA